AKLRITSDGTFATLTLPEGVKVEDVYFNKEYRKYLPELSLDVYSRTSDINANERIPSAPQYSVTDTRYSEQTYLNYLNMSTVWNSYKGNNVTVAVIDTGIDTDHPEFANKISINSYNATQDKVVKDYNNDWSLIEDEQGHGTSVAGVIASAMDGQGIVGIAPNVNLLVIKAECTPSGAFINTSDLVFGLYYAIEQDVDVVNMSFGGYGQNPYAAPLRLAVDSDIICVAAAGNDGTTQLCYPAADENTISAEDSWQFASYSNYGENVNIVAPGTTFTAKMDGTYGIATGTSLASPVVAGAMALLKQQNKRIEYADVQELLYASAYDLGGLGQDFTYGYGALDVSALLIEQRGKVTFDMLTDELEDIDQLFI
ncbi:MAG: S8 family serine peptidase, partial [Clostridia bacterium]|nr:S8 family serine peptidase [Clostridia bacterium]